MKCPNLDILVPVEEGETEPTPSTWIRKTFAELSIEEKALIGNNRITYVGMIEKLDETTATNSPKRVEESMQWAKLFASLGKQCLLIDMSRLERWRQACDKVR